MLQYVPQCFVDIGGGGGVGDGGGVGVVLSGSWPITTLQDEKGCNIIRLDSVKFLKSFSWEASGGAS